MAGEKLAFFGGHVMQEKKGANLEKQRTVTRQRKILFEGVKRNVL